MTTEALATQKCIDCGEEKPLVEYQRNSAGGRFPTCKKCMGAAIRAGQERNAAPTAPPPGQKRCIGCGQEKPLDAFHKHKAWKDGKDARCKECRNAMQRANHEARQTLQRVEGSGASGPSCVHKWLCGNAAILKVWPDFYDSDERVRPLPGTDSYGEWHACQACGLTKFVDAAGSHRKHYIRGASAQKQAAKAKQEREFEGLRPMEVVVRDGEMTEELELRSAVRILGSNGHVEEIPGVEGETEGPDQGMLPPITDPPQEYEWVPPTEEEPEPFHSADGVRNDPDALAVSEEPPTHPDLLVSKPGPVIGVWGEPTGESYRAIGEALVHGQESGFKSYQELAADLHTAGELARLYEMNVASLQRRVAELHRDVAYHKKRRLLAEVKLRIMELEREERELSGMIRDMEEAGYGDRD